MNRQKAILVLYLLAFFLISTRLFYWQVIRGNTLAEAAADQYYFTLQLKPSRGSILAVDESPLVTNKMSYFIYAEIPKITNVNKFAQKIAQTLKIDEKEVYGRITLPDVVWAPLQHKVSSEQLDELKELNLAGLGFETEGMRYYPEASMGAHLLGFVGSDENGNDRGYFGLEGFYDQALKGRRGSLIQEKDAQGLPIILGTTQRIAAEDGQTLLTHIDRSTQFIVEKRLSEGMERYEAAQGLVVIMDPKTGGIIADASYPNYDPLTFTEFDQDFYPNPLVSLTYEPGSTFKALIMSAALNEKKFKVDTKYNEDGPLQIGKYTIRTWNNEYHGEMTATEILEKSSNPGMVFVGRKLGREKLVDYIHDFGFGELTGIDLEGEEAANLRPRDEWKDIDIATASFGQGIAVTPIQMLRAVSVLANQGALMQPRVVREIIDPSGKTIEYKPKKVRQVIRPATAKLITEMMISAVDKGEAKWAKPAGYRIAGKTGTAQIPVAGHYDEEKTIASFVGFAPADDPKFVMLVVLREPSSSPWGSETAAPLFFQITKDLFAYYGISPKG